MAVRITNISRQTIQDGSGVPIREDALTVYWADDNDNRGVCKLDFATYTSIEAEWADGQGTTFTAIDAAMDAELASEYVQQDDETSSGISTGRGGYTFTG